MPTTQTIHLPIFSNKHTDSTTLCQLPPPPPDPILDMMSCMNLTFKPGRKLGGGLFKEHILILKGVYSTPIYQNITLNFLWQEEYCSNFLQESTLIVDPFETIKYGVFLQYFKMNNDLKKQLSSLYNLIKRLGTNRIHLLSLYSNFRLSIEMLGNYFWIKLAKQWLNWVKEKYPEHTLRLPTLQILTKQFYKKFFQNNFFIFYSKIDSIEKFCSKLEFRKRDNKKIKQKMKSIFETQISPRLQTFGIWLDIDNNVMIFSYAIIHEKKGILQHTKKVCSYCIPTISTDLLTKKVVLFLNIAILDFFKSNVF